MFTNYSRSPAEKPLLTRLQRKWYSEKADTEGGTRMRMRKKAWARPELAVCPFFIQNPEEVRGKWSSVFAKEQPIYLELGCGKSPFLAEMGRKHPDVNFIGIDLSMDVLGCARRNIVGAYGEEPVGNVVLLSYNIEYVDRILGDGDLVDRIYINFCNPWPKKKHQKRRLTYTRTLLKYREILKDGGEIWFKTDDDPLFDDSLLYFEEAGFAVLRQSRDLHAEADWPENVLTEHEIMFSEQGIPIKAAIAKKDVLLKEPVLKKKK